MFGVDDAIIAAAAPAAIGAVASAFGQHSANAVNQSISGKNMRWQEAQNKKAEDFSERMSNTQWQRGVEDMKKAGINPMLAFSRGGASAPTGVTSSGSAIPVQNNFSNAPASISSASQFLTKKAELDNLRKQNLVLDSQINLNSANASSASAAAAYNRNKAILAGKAIPGADNQQKLDQSWFGKVLPYANSITGLVGDVIGAASPVANIFRAFRGASDSFAHTRQGSVYNKRTGEVSRG